MRHTTILVALGLVLAACGAGAESAEAEGDLPVFRAEAFRARLDASDRPMVVNVWASWCLPCRTEAPLLGAAHHQYADRIEFIGIDIEDTQVGAAQFIAEYQIRYENIFDPNAEIRGVLGGQGVPITYFVAPGGALIDSHFGVIDEGQLALAIDELLARSG